MGWVCARRGEEAETRSCPTDYGLKRRWQETRRLRRLKLLPYGQKVTERVRALA